MQLYTPDNKLLLDTPVDDSSLRFKEVMGDNNLTLKFSLPEYLKAAGDELGIPLGSWCEFKAERYMLFSPENFVKQHSEHYDYTLILEAWIAYMKFVKFKFFTVERNPGQPDKMVGAPKLKFSLTATPEDFVRLMVDCMNFSGVTGWTVGECIESDPVTIDFNHDYCYGVLQKIADAFNTEWEVDNKTIHIRKVERKDGDGNRISFPLSYGYSNGILPGITRKQFDDSKVINRVWIQGGDRNINYGAYGNDTLLMPKNSTFEYEGKQYRTDETGCFVEPVGRTGSLSEDSLDTSKVYPKRVGTVTQVFEVDDAQGFYDFTDTSIPDTLDFSKMVIPGEDMTVVFQTGQLAGMEFDVKYVHSERRFKLVPNTDNGLIYPHGSIIPEAGDKYGVFHMSLPQEYIDSAEIEARDEAVKFLYENSQPKYTYQWQLDGIFAKEQWGAIGGFLTPGYFVKFSDPQFLPEPVDIRITSVKEYVNKPKSPTIEISNNVTGKALGAVLNEIPTQEQGTDRKDSVIKEYAKRRWKDTQELIDGIIGMSDEFQENLLSALVFEGMVFRAGAATLQYRFLADDWDTSIEPDLIFNKTEKRFYCPASRIKHETLEIGGQKPYWVIPEYRTDALDAATPYYLYLKCSKELAVVDGRLTGDAIFFISDQRIKIEDEERFYTLWVAFINSENEEGDRSFTTMYGLAELLPGQLTVDTLRSSDGKSFWKALKNQFKMGDGDNSLEYNLDPDMPNTLVASNIYIRQALKVIGEALIAGFYFSDEIIKSTAKVGNNPAMMLDGKKGLIELLSNSSGTGEWEEGGSETGGGSTNKKTSITISSNDGTVTTRNDDGVSMVGANGVFANHAGQGALPASSGIQAYGAVVGLGFGNLAKEQFFNQNFIAGVIGRASNSNPNPAPAYGGWFQDLMINGTVLNTKVIEGNTQTNNLYRTTSLVISLSSNQQDVYLPSDAYRGTVIWLKQWSQGYIRVYPPNGQRLYDDSTENSYIDVGEGYTAMCIFIDNISFSSDPNNKYGVWLLSKFKF
ncbi:hypothetical protein [Dysgonomonas sp.]